MSEARRSSHRRSDEWISISEAVRTRDGETCRSCGLESTDHDSRLHVHHLIPEAEFDTPGEAHQDTNLVLLCKSCHRSMEHLSLDRQKDELGIDSTEELGEIPDYLRELDEVGVVIN